MWQAFREFLISAALISNFNVHKVQDFPMLNVKYWRIFLHSVGPVNVCTKFEINRYQIDKFRKHAKSYVLFDVMWHNNGTSYVIVAQILLIGISICGFYFW